MEDTDLMPFGRFRGREMQDVPASYLLWLSTNNSVPPQVKKYIQDNLDVLEKEVNE